MSLILSIIMSNFDIAHVQVLYSISGDKDYYTADSQEVQLDLDPNGHDLPTNQIENNSGEVKIPADEVTG